jgi:hypothetical protein
MPDVMTNRERYDFYERIEESIDLVSIRNKSIDTDIKITKINCKKIVFLDIVFEKTLVITGTKCDILKIEFRRCEFRDWIALGDIQCTSIVFRECRCDTVIDLNDIQATGSLGIFQCSFANFVGSGLIVSHFNILYNQDSAFLFSDILSEYFEIICNKSYCDIIISGEQQPASKENSSTRIEELNIHTDVAFSGAIHIYDSAIQTLAVGGKLNKAAMDFSRVTVSLVKLQQFINTGIVKFSVIKMLSDSNLIIDETELGDAMLFGIDFQQFRSICILNSNLSRIVYAGITWCPNISSNDSMSFSQLRETYKQLKNVAIKQNDKPEELKFHSLEMVSYAKELSTDRRRIGDKFILWFNSITNENGQTWIKPIILISGTIFIFYFPIKILLGFNHFDARMTIPAFSEMAECLNPVRKFAESYGIKGPIEPNWKTGLAKLIDFFAMRVVIGLLLFQMVRAFRKFVR